MNLNKVVLIGRVTQNPEVKTIPSGQMVCTFGLATNRIWTNQETKQKEEKTEFHNIVLWRRLAEIASQYLSKGSLLLVEGRIQTRSWQDASGNKRYKTEIIGENIQLGPKSSNQGSQASFASNPESSKQPARNASPARQPDASHGGRYSDADRNIPIIEEDKGDKEIRVEDIPF